MTDKSSEAYTDQRFTVGSDNVFLDLGFEDGEAHALAVHSELFILLQRLVREKRWTKANVSRRLRLDQARAALLMKGCWEDFSIDELLALAWRAGFRAMLEKIT